MSDYQIQKSIELLTDDQCETLLEDLISAEIDLINEVSFENAQTLYKNPLMEVYL